MVLNPRMKIIVVDDMVTMRKIVSKMLQKIGFINIVEADDGASAWSLIEEAATDGVPFRFIICDWNMPRMNGLDLLAKVRGLEKTKSTPFLIITGEAEQSKVVRAVEAGVDDFIVKPFKIEVLEEKINKIFSES